MAKHIDYGELAEVVIARIEMRRDGMDHASRDEIDDLVDAVLPRLLIPDDHGAAQRTWSNLLALLLLLALLALIAVAALGR